MKNLKFFITLSVFTLAVSSVLIIKAAQLPQSIEGAQRTRIEEIIDANGGGGGAGDVTEAGDNAFTGSNTHSGSELFTGPFTAVGISNTIGTSTTTNFIRSAITMFNTNAYGDANCAFVYYLNGTRNNVTLFGDSPTLYIGDPFGSNNGYWQRNSTEMHWSWGGTGAIRWKRGSTDFMILDSGGWTLGNNSAYQNVFVGSTFTAANGANWNSGQLNITASGAITNGANGLFSLGTITASNLTATATDAITRWSSGTNMTGILDVNQGAGTLQTKALFTVSTNTPAGINPSSNVINTNGSQRLFVNISVAYGANSGTFLWTSTAQGPKNRLFSPAASTNFISGWVQPNATWTISNYVGTATCIPGEGHLETH